MNRRFRLRLSADFERVRRLGKSFAHPLIVLVVKDHPDQAVRVGVAAGRSLGNAVNRNRAKRLLRAAIQPNLANIRAGHDLILIARHPILHATFPEIRSALTQTLRRAELMMSHDE